jgi:3-oxoacyl-[acyl-carrier-protein] synthase II
MKRVVVTGIGLVTPLGCGNLNVWDKVTQSACGISSFETPKSSIAIAGSVKDFDVVALFGKQSHKYKSLSTHYALHASDIALDHARFRGGEGLDLNRAGVSMASGNFLRCIS